MNKMLALLGSVTALALAVPANAATVVPVGSTPNPYFLITAQTITDDFVTANFGATILGASTSFDDVFTFFLPLSGLGSGSVSTSSSSSGTALTITSVIINGVSESVSAAAAGISNVPITAFAPNTIEIIGVTGPNARFGTFTGTATFSAVVPEPATWATFLLGFGFLGFGLRRRAAKKLAIA